MPQPTANAVHIDAPLTNISVAYMQAESRFIAGRVFPTVPVEKKSDKYFKYSKDAFFRDEAALRAPATESAGGGYGVTTDSYSCDVFAYHKDVDGQTRSNTDNPLDADRDAAKFVATKMLIRREVQFLSDYFTTSIWTGSTTGADLTPGTLWSAANSTPIEDVDAQIWNIALTGEFPNKFVVGPKVWQALKNHAEILDRIKFTQRGILTTELLSSMLAPPEEPNFEVLVASAVKDTAAEGQTSTLAFMADSKDALLVHAAPSPGLQTVSGGYIFAWTGFLGAGAYGNAVYRFPMPQLGVSGGVTERIEGEISFDCKLVAADLGAYWNNTVA
jgi:hypothetical protein